MLEWGCMRINNTLVWWNEVPWESTCYWFSCGLITAYWGIVDYHGTSFHHTNVLLILMWPHSSILMYYWFENQQYLSMLEWGHMKINNILVYWNEVTWESITNQYGGMRYVVSLQHTEVLLILMVPHSTILMCYWFSCDLIPAYWCIIDCRVTLYKTSVCCNEVTWESITLYYAGIRSHENE
jgi:hypothetical protein